MKISYLEQALVDLNDGESIERDSTFVTAANLALGHISRIIPEERTAYIEAVAPIIGVVGEVDTSRVYSGAGVCTVSFRAKGRGKLICEGEVLTAWTSLTGWREVCIRFDAPRDVAISFAEVRGTVRDLALLDVEYAEDGDVPMFGSAVRYDMRRIAPDYGGFIKSPVNAVSGRVIQGAVMESPYLKLPYTFAGEAAVTYRHSPMRVTLDDVGNDAEIDIRVEYEDLLPLCMAYYVWLEDEPTKAAFFLARFNEMASLAAQQRQVPGRSAVISNGW